MGTVFQLLTWRSHPAAGPQTNRARPGQTCLSVGHGAGSPYPPEQPFSPSDEAEASRLIRTEAYPRYLIGVYCVLHSFFLSALPKTGKTKLINFKNNHGHYFKSTREQQREQPVPWLPRRSPPTAPLGALEHPQSRRAGAEGSRDFTCQRPPHCQQPLPVGGARGASRFILRNKQTLKGIRLHTHWWKNFPL